LTNLSNELPDKIYVPLGRRGFHPINLKACVRCFNAERFVLNFIEKKEYPAEIIDNAKKEIIDYKVQCKNCNAIYFIRMTLFKNIDENKEEQIIANFNILDENGNDEGWLGSTYI